LSRIPAIDAELTVVPVEGRALWRQFHNLPRTLYRDDPNWIAPLRLERRMHFDPKHNPFFQHAKVAFWLALRGDVPVGRITAQIDALYIERYNDATGHFGFIEAVDDPAVFRALLDTAEGWLRAHGMRRSVGPVSFAMWDEPGLLVEGFDRPPNVMMGHALPYYQQRIAETGYSQLQDLLAYERSVRAPLPDKMQKMIERAQRMHNFVLRPIRTDRKGLAADIETARDILNDAWSENWGFVPITEAEVADIAELFKLLLKPDALIIAEFNGEGAGVGMLLPNLNEMIRDLDGRLLPFGFLKLWWRLNVKGPRSGRMALMGVRKKWGNSAGGAALATMIIKKAQNSHFARNVLQAELSWILDSNKRMKRILEMIDAKIIKRYRIYEKTIG
jgi:hypothetical protein